MPISRLLSHLNLTVALAVIGVADLVYHRIVSRMLLPHAALGAQGNRFLMAVGTFWGHWAAILGLFVLLNALLARGNRRLLFPRPIQISLIFVAVVFFFLATRGVVSPLGQRNLLHLQISHGFLALFVGVGLWYRGDGSTVPARLRLGASLFALPVLLHTAVVFLDRLGNTVSGATIAFLNHTGEGAALLAGLLSPLLLGHIVARDARRIVGLAIGILVATSAATAALWRFDLLRELALQGLGLHLPSVLTLTGKLWTSFFVVALSAAVWTGASLLLTPGGPRLVGCGILLMVTAGYQASAPGELVLSLAGLFALALGIKRGDVDAGGASVPEPPASPPSTPTDVPAVEPGN